MSLPSKEDVRLQIPVQHALGSVNTDHSRANNRIHQWDMPGAMSFVRQVRTAAQWQPLRHNRARWPLKSLMRRIMYASQDAGNIAARQAAEPGNLASSAR
jgi:hypothetical protein